MKTILVPIDFSSTSITAMDYAAQLAKQNGADLFLLHVYNDPMPVTEGSLPFGTMDIELQEDCQVRIQKESKRLIENYGVHARGEVKIGFKGDTIKDTAEEMDAGLICVGRRLGNQKPLLGSTILKAVRKTGIPIMVIPEGTVYQPPKRIVLAVDYKEMLSYNCLTPLFQLVNPAEASLSVLHIEKAGEMLPPSEVPEKLQLDRVLSRISYLNKRVEDDNIEEGILKFISAHSTDLLVMIAHRHNLFARLFSDVHTPKVVFEVPVPLLILKNEPTNNE